MALALLAVGVALVGPAAPDPYRDAPGRGMRHVWRTDQLAGAGADAVAFRTAEVR